MSPALAIRGLVKHFDRPAVDGLDLTVQKAEFYTLLGPNGAGKTTTLRMVAGVIVVALLDRLERRFERWRPDVH